MRFWPLPLTLLVVLGSTGWAQEMAQCVCLGALRLFNQLWVADFLIYYPSIRWMEGRFCELCFGFFMGRANSLLVSTVIGFIGVAV
jgi:hypothetical protein